MINNYENNISFKGATRWLKKEIFIKRSSIEKITNSANSEFVGCLPKDMLDIVINTSKSKKEKTKRIKNIMEGFSTTAKEVNNFIKKLQAKEDYFLIPESIKFENMRRIVEKELKTVFKKNKILKFLEKIEVDFLGDGSYGNVFLIKFPQKAKLKPLVFKHFKEDYISPDDLLKNFPILHGKFAENNIMIYVTNLFKKAKEEKIIANGYFGSLKNDFLITEYIPDNFRNKDWIYTEDGQKTCIKINQILEKYNLFYDDFRPENLINKIIIDYGGIKTKLKKYFKQNKDFYNMNQYML